MANLMLSVMGAFAEFECSLIRERQREGIDLAKQRGAYTQDGKRPSDRNGPPSWPGALAPVSRKPSSLLARDYGISRETVYQYLRNAKLVE